MLALAVAFVLGSEAEWRPIERRRELADRDAAVAHTERARGIARKELHQLQVADVVINMPEHAAEPDAIEEEEEVV